MNNIIYISFLYIAAFHASNKINTNQIDEHVIVEAARFSRKIVNSFSLLPRPPRNQRQKRKRGKKNFLLLRNLQQL